MNNSSVSVKNNPDQADLDFLRRGMKAVAGIKLALYSFLMLIKPSNDDKDFQIFDDLR